jgi:hypothetical protein
MALMDGKKKDYSSGGNTQRQKFNSEVSGLSSKKAKPETKAHAGEEPGTGEGGGITTITHHGDGTHSVMHHDGETTEHPSTGHMLMGLHAKHEMGGGGHMHSHGGMEGAEGSVTTHHVGMDGEVQGPHHHADEMAAGEHLANALGEGSTAMHDDSAMESYPS